MPRYVVAIEDKAPFPGVFLTKGCLKWPEGIDKLVVMNPSPLDDPIGYAKDFERNEETNEVSVDITFFEPRDDVKNGDFSVGAKELVADHRGDVQIVKEATLWYVILIGGPPVSQQSHGT